MYMYTKKIITGGGGGGGGGRLAAQTAHAFVKPS